MDNNRKEEMRFYNCLTGKKYFPNWEKSFSQLGTYFQGTYVRPLMNLCSSAHEHMFIGSRTYVLRMMMVLVMMMGVGGVWGQNESKPVGNDYSGTYYIANYNNGGDRYYLCPSTSKYTTDQPFLTTHKNSAEDDDKLFKWIVRYAKTVDYIDYYYLIHVSSNTEYYLTYNDAPVSNNDARIRVHLQSNKDDEKSLFYFERGTLGDKKNYNIYPKSDKRSLNPAKANTDFYEGTAVSNAGTWNSIQLGGLIGVYGTDDKTGVWYLEDIVETPTVSIDSDGKAVISSSNTSATYYYTTDGTTKPTTTGSGSTQYTDPIVITGIETIKAIAVLNGEVSNVATYTVGNGTPYIIQNQESTVYYLISGDKEATNVPANTSSIYGPKMEWLLKYAGNVNGIQYYYFVNNDTKHYLYRTGDNIYVKEFAPIDDGYRFNFFTQNTDGSYNIYPKDVTNKTLYKKNGNVASDNVVLSDNLTDFHGQWKFIKTSGITDKRSLFEDSPVEESKYYKIESCGTPGSYIISPVESGGTEYAGVSDTETNDNMVWVFKEAGHDEWQTYYNIVHATTGKYMYYRGPTGTVTTEKAIEMKETCTDDDRFQFVLARNKDADYYHIIPKTHKDVFKSNLYYNIWLDTEILKTINHRSSGGVNVKWKFVEAPIRLYIDPTITQDVNGNISITHPTNACDYYYTVDGTTDPTIPDDGADPVAPTYKYNGPFLPPLGTTKIKAKAAIKDDHNIVSGVVEYELPALTSLTISFDNTTSTVTIASLAGATIYYACGSTDPADPEVDQNVTHGSSPVTIPVNDKTYIKAIAVKEGFTASAVQSKFIDKVATPVIDVTSDGKVKLTSNTTGVIIYYEIGADVSSVPTPTPSSTRYTTPLSNMAGKVIKAIAVKNGWITSDMGGSEGPISMQCAMPIIRRGTGNTFTISCSFPTEGVHIYYTTGNGAPTTLYEGPVSIATYPVTIKAIAKADDYNDSSLAEETITQDLMQDDGYYLIASAGDFEKFVTMANSTAGAGNKYKVVDNFTVSGNTTVSTTFTGTFVGDFDEESGEYFTISGLRQPLFNSTNNAVIKNVMLKDVQISGSGAKGAIAGTANGYTRIYNCGILPSSNKFESETSDISSSDNHCGGLVGDLNDNSRVVNCFSYAKITGGTVKGGIVGYNQTASTTAVTNGKYANLKTMVVNCMFYGDITGSSGVYPVYGGSKILNKGDNGINNYNYYRAEASITPTDYNCSWPASEENLTRFEYYRYLLNSNRELCGWWVKSDVAPSTMNASDVQAIDKDASLMAKWVLDPALAPYPILKSAGKYPSVINPDPDQRIAPDTKKWVSRTVSENTIQTNAAPDIEGETLGTISVTINAGIHHSGSKSRDITITAMDIDNNDFCYGKIQLPYYNDVFGKSDGSTWSEKYGDNYTGMVVTGWDITTSEGKTGTFSDDPITGYNFADRNCTAKDTHRVFAQGGFYYVPYGVTSITITAHWANAYYLSNTDGNYDRVYFSENNANKKSAGKPFAPAGTRSFESGAFGGQTINNGTITSILNSDIVGNSVYDCAIVLVSNYQYRSNTENIADDNNNRKPFTLMTVDLDFDNEPDYCFEWQFGGGQQGVTRAYINPVRFDFLPIVELGIAMKEDNSQYLFAIGKVTPYGHFETTETALIHMGQFEYDDKNRDVLGPVILNNGTFDQICRGSESDNDQNVNYFILGGHVKMPSFTPGSHVRKPIKSRHCAVNVLGGEITYFYLSGNYNATPTNEGNPHCYIDGGKLDFVASGAKEKIVGNVFWEIDHSCIGEFYGGGINADKPVQGNISTTINRSKVTKFCGGPQFGNMVSGKTVTTEATGTTFGVFYGAGNGGTCYSQFYSSDFTTASPNWETISDNISGGMEKYIALTYVSKSQGYHAKYELEMINSSAGTMNNAVCRTYMYAAQFATTTTGTVNSTLTDCTVNGNFFGGGLLGGVTGNVTSTLKGHTVVNGSVYGGGYGIADLTVDVLPKGYTPPTRDSNTSVITLASYPDATTYYWTHDTSFGNTTLSTSSPAILNPNGDGKNYLYTEISLDALGAISGNATLNLEDDTEVHGDVFGGGDKGLVTGTATVNIDYEEPTP